ncbi:MAG: TRAP transporter substrate-binding protein [Bdellovibrionota bacterium]|jgi:TRAP-type mannitol/chloroaromatic compound transport system substrate-binding protein
MKRRNFIQKTLLTSLAAIGTARLTGNTLTSNAFADTKRLRWRLALGVPRTLPIWGSGMERFVQTVKDLTGGGLNIRLYGAGELVPALETFDAVRSAKIEMGHSAAYYWQGKIPASTFFTAIPFNTGALEMLSWLQCGGGQQLYDEAMEPHGVIAFPCGATPAQMAGWFNRRIESVEDLKGLKIRIAGFANKVYKKAGASPVLVPGGEIFTSLSTGVIDAAEWVGPYHDSILGLDKAAQYYYGPGWQEQGPLLELMINQRAWQALPQNYQRAIQVAANDTTIWMLNEFHAKNAEYLEKIKTNSKVTILRLPNAVLEHLKQLSEEVMHEVAERDEMAKRVLQSVAQFQKNYRDCFSITHLT